MSAGGEEEDLVFPIESSADLLMRQAQEKTDLTKRLERIKSSIPKKDRAGRARHAEDAAEEERLLMQRHAGERDDKGITEDAMTAAVSMLTIDAKPKADARHDVGVSAPRNESKAARRRRKKAEQEAESNRRIAEEKAGMGPSPKFMESEAIQSQLEPKQLRIHPIPADGHCLYSAVAHQIETNQFDSNVPPTVEGLRNATADHLMVHKQDFMPFIETVNGNDVLYEAYCEQLRNEAVWGGQVELRALAEILGANIEVYAANMPIVKMGSTENSSPVLRVSFHREYFGLGEHYNSVVPRT